jgi:hypothetical protein
MTNDLLWKGDRFFFLLLLKIKTREGARERSEIKERTTKEGKQERKEKEIKNKVKGKSKSRLLD